MRHAPASSQDMCMKAAVPNERSSKGNRTQRGDHLHKQDFRSTVLRAATLRGYKFTHHCSSTEGSEKMAEREPNVLWQLTAEERNHLEIVDNIYDFVEAPRSYLAWGEFSNLREY